MARTIAPRVLVCRAGERIASPFALLYEHQFYPIVGRKLIRSMSRLDCVSL